MKWNKKVLVMLTLAIGLLVTVGCSSKNSSSDTSSNKINKEAYSEQQYLMGTYVRVQIYDDGKEAVLKKAFDRVKELADIVTVNEPDAENSEVEEINRQAGIKPVKVREDVYNLIEKAFDYTADSAGGFDFTIGPITSLWRIGFDDARKPSQAEIDEKLKLVDYHDVALNKEEQTVYLKKKGMQLDLGAIAKGFITDEVVEVLKENGVTTGIVDLGGNVFVLGKSPNKKNGEWTVGIQDPDKERNQIVGSTTASNRSLVTSGIYERFLEVDGVKYHHLFDATTGYPFDNEIAGVSIISDKSVDGDGLSTVVFSMGLEKGLDYVNSRPDIDAVFITKEHKVYISDGLKDNFKMNLDSGYELATLD
ncbi:FAD:protein FMN transferase [Vagococcus xieshaowenii]|uniref:FAD:protein FMN transferase n=1 Tax=Vagococcus xieshaowenii TaxID=2562451 RepID=A0AAJ5JM74_9ENTE|nr:FAD:protein FMN transferase [Vagococcus xieshaowenii]QCA29551.1 FAD:protein FMN transferase [Vagococcus xieshaowenii]TFZ42667.1 FAD:protein FMN transferase [Vagococcus xieshaowenii]